MNRHAEMPGEPREDQANQGAILRAEALRIFFCPIAWRVFVDRRFGDGAGAGGPAGKR